MTRALNLFLWGILLITVTSCGKQEVPEVTTPVVTPPAAKEKKLPQLKPEKKAKPMEAPTHKVGLLLPLSGPHEKLGKGMLQAAEMALFEANQSSVTLLPQDTARGAHQAALKALDEGAEILLGPIFAGEVESIKPLLNARSVNLISFSTDQNVADKRTFVLGFLPAQQIERVVLFAKQKGGLSKMAAFIPDGPYGRHIEQTLKRLDARGDIQLLGIATYTRGDLLEGNPGNARLVEEVEIYKKKGLEALVVPEGGENLAHLTRILKPMLPLKFLGSGQWDGPATLKHVKAGLEGALFASPTPEERKNFEARFQKAYGSQAPRIATLAYDATALVISLADRGYTVQNITFSEGFVGIDGLFRLTPAGLNERALAVLEVAPEGIKVMSPAPEGF